MKKEDTITKLKRIEFQMYKMKLDMSDLYVKTMRLLNKLTETEDRNLEWGASNEN